MTNTLASLAILAAVATQPAWWEELDAEERAELAEVAAAIGMEPWEVVGEDGYSLNPEAERRMRAHPELSAMMEAEDRDGAQRARQMRAEYLENVARMGRQPDPAVLKVLDDSVARYEGEASAAAGGPARPAAPSQSDAAAEMMGSILGGSDAPGPAPASLTSRPSVERARAAFEAIPPDRKPTMAFQNYWFGVGAMGTESRIWSEYVFPSGYLLSCDGYDPSAAPPTPEGVASLGLDCEPEAVRVRGARYETRDVDGTWSVEADANLVTDGGAAPGQRFDLAFGNGSGVVTGFGDTSASRLDQGSLVMTAEGRIVSGNTVRVDAPGAMVAGRTVVVGNQTTIRSETTLSGYYHADGHLMTIALDDGPVVTRTFTLSRDEDGRVDGLFLDGEYYWASDE